MRSSRLRTLFLSTLLLVEAKAFAYSEGITGRSATGCLGIIPSCHNDTMGMRNGAMVTIEGPTMVEAGARVTYTLRVARTDMGALAGAGLNVSASGGALRSATASATRVANCELTHAMTIPVAMMGASEVRIPFDFIAPAASTTVTLQAAGNAVDGNGEIRGMPGQTGDQWGTTQLSVMITGTSDGGGVCPEPVDASVDGGRDAGTDVVLDVASDTGSTQDGGADGGSDVASDGAIVDESTQPPRPGCACAAPIGGGDRARGGALLLLALAACSTRARKR